MSLALRTPGTVRSRNGSCYEDAGYPSQRSLGHYSERVKMAHRDLFDRGRNDCVFSSGMERGRSADLRRRHGTSGKRAKSLCDVDMIRASREAREEIMMLEDEHHPRDAPTPGKSRRSVHDQLMRDVEHDSQRAHYERTPAQGRKSAAARTPGQAIRNVMTGFIDKAKEFSSPFTGGWSGKKSMPRRPDDDESLASPVDNRYRESPQKEFRNEYHTYVVDDEGHVFEEPSKKHFNTFFVPPPPAAPWVDHVRLPIIISRYTQLLLNFAVVGACLLTIYNFCTTVNNDIEAKVRLYSDELLEEITRCKRDYSENKCDPKIRVPAMEDSCRDWEACMNRDPYDIARRSKFSGETLGEAVNAFFNALEWKAVVCMSLLFFGTLFSYNFCFWLFSKRFDSLPPPQPQYLPYPPQQHEQQIQPQPLRYPNFKQLRQNQNLPAITQQAPARSERRKDRRPPTTTPRRYRESGCKQGIIITRATAVVL